MFAIVPHFFLHHMCAREGWVAEFQMLIYRVLISLWFFNTTSVPTPVEDVKSHLRYQGELLGPHIWESSLDHDSGEKK